MLSTIFKKPTLATNYRNPQKRRQIICAIAAESRCEPLSKFQLTDAEENYYRAQTERLISKLTKESSGFTEYYALKTAKPFNYVVYTTLIVILTSFITGFYLASNTEDTASLNPIFAALATASVVAIGWAVAGWINHRNTTRQHTINMLFARFSHAPFSDAIHRFHKRFGYTGHPYITKDVMDHLRKSSDEEDRKDAAAVSYILNYYELICASVIRGDLDKDIVRDNIRGLIVYYHDKCFSHIRESNKTNSLIYQNLIKVRTHYREV